VICPQCGRTAEIVPGEHPFCRHCDYPLFWVAPRPTPVTPIEFEPEPVVGVVCAACSTHNESGRTLCRLCGQPLIPLAVRRRRSWEVVVPEEPAQSPRKKFILGIAAGIASVALLALLVGSLWYFFWPRAEWEVVILDEGESSWDVAATLQRGLPVISYVDASDFTLRVVACGSPFCDGLGTPTIRTTVAVIGDRGQGYGTAIVVGADGHPVIAFRDGVRQAMMVAHCGDPQCSDPGAITITELDPGAGVDDPAANVGSDISMAIGLDGLPIIAYHDITRGALKVAHCENKDCTESTIAVLDRSADAANNPDAEGVGLDTSIQVGRDGLPIIAFRDADDRSLRIAHCSDERCTQAVLLTMVQAPGLDPGHDSALVLAPDGSPIVAYTDWSDDGVYVAKCADATCADVTVRRIDRAEQGTSGDTSIVIDREGQPVVVFRQKEPGDERASRILKIVYCRDLGCERSTEPEAVDSVGRTGYTPRLLVLNDGTIAIAYGDATQGALEYAVLR